MLDQLDKKKGPIQDGLKIVAEKKPAAPGPLVIETLRVQRLPARRAGSRLSADLVVPAEDQGIKLQYVTLKARRRSQDKEELEVKGHKPAGMPTHAGKKDPTNVDFGRVSNSSAGRPGLFATVREQSRSKPSSFVGLARRMAYPM
ncbi:hypothetical protein CALCODRAFT_508393 [Calocera cornea HHB12733]|uniref:Uncharacterized protein n=1 Tax=Calocera cornea HHB12733 TaxID=1353952 RepID=A0A165GIN7_9BASI|nr:hypothetical protein CALCODRAFT_508393 [Calocera cornea HHB12733]